MFYEVFYIKLHASQTKHYMIYSVKLSFLLICFISILNYTFLKHRNWYRFSFLFCIHIKLHAFQTQLNILTIIAMFCIHIKLHASQTSQSL